MSSVIGSVKNIFNPINKYLISLRNSREKVSLRNDDVYNPISTWIPVVSTGFQPNDK